MRELARAFAETRKGRSLCRRNDNEKSAPDLDLVGDYRAFFVANWFDVGDGKAAVAEIWKSFAQGVMQFVLQSRSFFGRGEYVSIDTVGLVIALFSAGD